MKIGQTIKVVNSNPADEHQSGISEILNKEFQVVGHWKEKENREVFADGEIQVHAEEFGGIICLNKNEYIVV